MPINEAVHFVMRPEHDRRIGDYAMDHWRAHYGDAYADQIAARAVRELWPKRKGAA
jgi:hypothetical protein